MTTQQRQALMYGLIVLFMIIFGGVVYWYFTLCTLTVATDSASNTILVRQQNGSQTKQINVNQSGSRIDIKIGAGTYIVTVQNNSLQSSSQIVTLHAGEHKSLIMNLAQKASIVPTTEPVSSLGAGSIASSKDLLRFIDRNAATHLLYSVGSDGTVTVLDPDTSYSTISWADPTFGIGFGTNKQNQYVLTKIDGNFATAIKAPFTPGDQTSAGVAPNQNWYISDGQTVYRGNADGSFTVVYKASDKVKIVSVSNDAIFLAEGQGQGRAGTLVSLHTNGDKYQINGEAYEASWSPSGDKLVTSGDTSELLDSKLNKIGTLPSGNFISPIWLDDNTLLYNEAGSVWRYDLTTGSSTTLVTFDAVTGTPSQIALSQERDYIYVSIQEGGDTPGFVYKLHRIALDNQPQADLPLQKLDLLIPNTIKGCSLDYMNFGHFSILTRATAGPANCIPSVTSYLASYNVSLSGISFQQLQ